MVFELDYCHALGVIFFALGRDQTDVEPSKSQLINMINRVPTEPDFVRYLDPIVLDMSLEQYWDCFYANNAMYYVSDIQKDPLDKFVSQTEWHDPTQPEFETAFGKPV